MYTLKIEYDGAQHATALNEPHHNTVAIDCPFTGKGVEFSPASLFGISLASCMLLSMGAIAQRDGIDLKGTTVDIRFSGLDKTFPHVDTITLTFRVPQALPEAEQQKLERAAALCPIRQSIDAETVVDTTFLYGAAEL
ncbi:MAG: OsmC family protein [Woeseiaceae bacterium]|nr:OsmC family protein [Woeseiaceae bacterium]